ncbi:MAG: alpha/beta fold hydrolase [Eubacterium sp.]|nr:alpha/beta fold hydrolase [Eubacterium sp.]
MNTPTKKTKFICLPGGGTSSVVFYKWFGLLDEHYRPSFIDLPGRGLRKSEAPLTDIHDITSDLMQGLKKILSDDRDEEYVLFGYCMGAIFLYELIRKIKDEKLPMPSRVFIAAADVPYGEMYKIPFLENPATKNQFYDLIKSCFPEHTFPDNETMLAFRKAFVDIIYRKYEEINDVTTVTIQDLKAAGCEDCMLTSFEFTESLKLANDLMRILTIDCKICSDYQSRGGTIDKLSCPVTCMTGSEDLLYPEKIMNLWKDYTDKECTVHVVNGGHRILLDPNPEAIAVINRMLPAS